MSLKNICLRDFVIVQALDLDLTDGFTVLTGETGAGKSILIDALQLALGARADAAVVREGAQRCEVSAEFDAPPALAAWLENAGLAQERTEGKAASLLLRRTVDVQGKSRAWINGSAATATQLREVADYLVDIHGQHAWQSLTRPQAVRGLLDAYASLNTERLLLLWQQWRQAQKTWVEAQAAQDQLQSERERLSWQISEVDKLAPGADEWQELNTQHTRLAHAQALRQSVQTALDALQEGEENATDLLARAHTTLQNQEHIEPEFKGLADVLTSILVQTQDTAHALRSYARHGELDPEHLQQLDERVALWLSLARRYKRQPAELPALLATWRSELQRLDAAADLAALEQAQEQAHQAYLQEAQCISRQRGPAATALGAAITQAMQGLGMQGGCFEVKLSQLEQPTAYGLEQVEFLVAGHSGSTARPITKVASGGELSRIALAIAVTTSCLGQAGTLIFDEVDAGVGGAVAETVGRLMKQLGQDRQVLAVTHLPQVAACADQHLSVSKRAQQGQTLSSVEAVRGEQRVAEIARMLGGKHLSGTTLAHAKEMLGS